MAWCLVKHRGDFTFTFLVVLSVTDHPTCQQKFNR